MDYKPIPPQHRPCRDVICAALFLLGVTGFAVGTIYMFSQADIKLLLKPFDKYGKPCGLSERETYQQLLYLGADKSFCVKECPKINQNIQCFIEGNDYCPPLPFNTTSLLKFCVFDVAQTVQGIPQFQRLMNDLAVIWPLLIASACISLVMGLAVLLLARVCVGVLVWALIVLSLIITSFIGMLSFLLYNGNQWARAFVNWQNLPQILKNSNVTLTVGILSLVVALVLLLTVCCCCSKISISIMILKASAQFSMFNFYSLLVPVITLVLTLAVSIFSLASCLCTYSTGQIMNNSTNHPPYADFALQNDHKVFMGYTVFMWIWLVIFLFGCTQYLIAHSVASWYYEHSGLACCLDLVKNTGSLALGSFLLTLLFILKWVLTAMTYYNQRIQGTENACAVALNRCALCCIATFQRCIKFITDNSYIVMAATGLSFFDSAQEAISIVASKPILFSICEFACWLIESFGKVLIVASSILICYLWANRSQTFSTNIYQAWFPLLLFGIVALPGAITMMSFFGYSSNAILVFFLKDRQQFSHSKKCPESLKHFIDAYGND